MSEIRIRKAEADDLPIMQGIARRTIDKCYRTFLGDEAVDWFLDSGESDSELEKHLQECDVLLRKEVLVAFAISFDDLIHLMMVDVSLHRSGIGSRLLDFCEHELFSQGHSPIRLETFAGNRQAIGFYLKNGWSVIKQEKDKEHDFIRVFFEKQG